MRPHCDGETSSRGQENGRLKKMVADRDLEIDVLKAAAPTWLPQSTAAASADGDQSRLGVRLRVRHVREWPDAEVPHDHRVHGAPRYLRSDNGPEFVARAILRWLQTAVIETAFIDPGKPWQNGADESFNGKFRDQHLSLQLFRNRLEAKVSIEA